MTTCLLAHQSRADIYGPRFDAGNSCSCGCRSSPPPRHAPHRHASPRPASSRLATPRFVTPRHAPLRHALPRHAWLASPASPRLATLRHAPPLSGSPRPACQILAGPEPAHPPFSGQASFGWTVNISCLSSYASSRSAAPFLGTLFHLHCSQKNQPTCISAAHR